MLRNLKLGVKIGGGFILILLLTAFIAWIGWSNAGAIVNRVDKADDVNRLVKQIARARQSEKNFIIRSDEKYAKEVNETVNELKKQIDETKSKFKDAANKQQMDTVLSEVSNYETGFNNFHELHKKKAETDKSMVDYGRKIEASAEELKNDQKEQYFKLQKSGVTNKLAQDKLEKADDADRIVKWLLQARRHEKNYVIRKDKEYISKVETNIDSIIKTASSLKLRFKNQANIAKAEEIISQANGYKTAFESFVKDTENQNKAEETMLASARSAQEECDKARADQKKKMTERIAMANSLIIGFSLGAIVMGLFMAFLITKSVTDPVNKTLKLAKSVATGDLTAQIDVDQKDEIGDMVEAIKQMMANLREVVSAVQSAIGNVASGSQEMSSSAEELSQGAVEQAASVEEISSSIEQMSSNAKQNSDNSNHTETIALKASEEMKKGSNAVLETVDAMKNIASKISIVQEIARQTDLLALNAAIEAARAGDHGKGFAVVASEVRKLAERSQSAAKEISEMSISSVRVSSEAGNLLKEVTPEIQKTAELVQEISAASNEQTLGAQQVNKAVQQLDQVVQQNASASEELAATAEELNSQAERLKEIVAFFKVDVSMGGFRQETVHADIISHSPAGSRTPAQMSSDNEEYKHDSADEHGVMLNMSGNGYGKYRPNGNSNGNGNGNGNGKHRSNGNGNGNGKTVVHDEDFIRF